MLGEIILIILIITYIAIYVVMFQTAYIVFLIGPIIGYVILSTVYLGIMLLLTPTYLFFTRKSVESFKKE